MVVINKEYKKVMARQGYFNYMESMECLKCSAELKLKLGEGEWNCICCGVSFAEKNMRGKLEYNVNSWGKKIDWVEPRKKWCKFCYKKRYSK